MSTAFAAQAGPTLPSGTPGISGADVSASATAAQASSPLSGAPLGLLRAGVSVVRLLVRYDKPNNSGTVYCTGLGVIVASWPAQSATDQNNWVLTDSSLVNGKQAVCADEHPQATLTSIEVSSSTYYNQQQAFTFESALGSVTCQEANCQSGSALFALGRTAQNQLFPFIDLAQQHSTSNQDMAIALTTSASVISKSRSSAQPPLPTPSIASSNSLGASTFQAQASQFRTPNEFSPTDTLEAGTPVINSNGQLTGLHLKAPSANNDIQAFINTTIPGLTSHPPNKVHDAWQQSLDAYSQGDLKTARTQFQIAATANPSFQGANIFAAPSNPAGSNSGEGQPNPTNTITIAGGAHCSLAIGDCDRGTVCSVTTDDHSSTCSASAGFEG